jgi:hypothetical protein
MSLVTCALSAALGLGAGIVMNGGGAGKVRSVVLAFLAPTATARLPRTRLRASGRQAGGAISGRGRGPASALAGT